MNFPQLFKTSLFLLFPVLLFGNGDLQKVKHTKEKTIKKEFSVSSDATLEINNSYGNLNIVTWNENRIVIEVHITVSSGNEEAAQKKLHNIGVQFQASRNRVSANTLFDKNNDRSWWDKFFDNNSVNMQIDYLVKMPITNDVDLNNDYGSINLGKLQGRAVINCDYGKIVTEELMADNNSLTFDYSDGCYFEYIKSGTINADYSGFTVAKAEDLNITADYTNSHVKIAEDVVFDCDYGSMEINQANNIKGNGDYLTMRVGDVHKNIKLEADYGSIHIDRMMKNAGDVLISTDYTGIEIGLQPGYSFEFSIDLEYASLETPDGFDFSREIRDSSESLYEGFFGNSNTGNSVTIESDYGNVEFYMN
ncbi:MAG TPA: hypothetical protein VFM65_04260 [Flavobacteriaceae bacterium]|nr:hypothetical protein [Flavobacteriaceae bacterium]